MMQLIIYGLLIFIGLFYPVTPGADKPKKLINVLIIDGFSNHDWQQTTLLTRRILEETHRFKVSVSTAPATQDSNSWASWNPVFKNYDVIIQNTNNIQNKKLRWPRRVEEQLERYVKSGGGLYILHSANNAFPHWPEYDVMIGLGWRPKETGYALEIDQNRRIIRIPPGAGSYTNHGKRFVALIQTLTPHPINKGMPDQWLTPSMELYTHARGPAENLTVLSFAADSTTHKNWPVEWVVRYGKGRVYNSSMGHLWKGETYPISYRCIGFQTTLIRATEWLATGKVTYPVPANFPTKAAISVRQESDFPD
jgi:type 1 glutamine amidotransferase